MGRKSALSLRCEISEGDQGTANKRSHKFLRRRKKHPMTLLKAIPTVFCAALIGAAISPSVKADDWNRKTVITFSAPVEIPGVHLAGWAVLPAGTYVFKVLDSASDRHIVQIFSKDELTVYATILAIPNYRLRATNKTVMTFRERPAGQAGSPPRVVLSGPQLGRGIRLP